jgi:hypothetical protein
MTTTTDLSFARLVTRTLVPKGRLRPGRTSPCRLPGHFYIEQMFGFTKEPLIVVAIVLAAGLLVTAASLSLKRYRPHHRPVITVTSSCTSAGGRAFDQVA